MADQPTPKQIDGLALEILLLEAKRDRADEAIAEKKAEALPLVEKFGTATSGKTKTLAGETHELSATFGQCTTLDQNAVEKFKTALAAEGRVALFRKCFSSSLKFIALPNADALLEKASKKVVTLYRQCFITKSNKPAVKAVAKNAEKASA